MPVHEIHFSVRYAECDAYNHVNHAHYVRFMNEAALSASTAAGFSVERLADSGQVWLAREHDIEFIQPLLYGDQVRVKTWVADFRRVRSWRRYDLFRGDQLAARAATDWVFIDKNNGRPSVVPAGMAERFQRLNGLMEADDLTRTPFPEPAPLAPQPFHYRLRVEWRDVDPQRHVNNAAYISYLENATWELLREKGWPLARMVDRRLGIVARRYRIEYLAPAMMGDELEITTWVSDARRATAVRHYLIHRPADDLLLVRARAFWVWIDLHTGQPRRIPEDFRAGFYSNFTSVR